MANSLHAVNNNLDVKKQKTKKKTVTSDRNVQEEPKKPKQTP